MNEIIYMDYAATSPMKQVVIDTVLPYMNVHFGNPSSHAHPYGWEAKEAIEIPRKQLADLIGAEADEVFFTSGATESINWAHKAYFEWQSIIKKQIITQKTEHASVLNTCLHIEQMGGGVNYLGVSENGEINLADLENYLALNKKSLISIMSVNNETGIKQPIDSIGKLAEDHDCFFFCDATQSIGKEKIDVDKINIDLLSVSAHKIGGPKGCGALYISKKLQDQGFGGFIRGGSQEFGLRAGTENVPAIMGFGKAVELLKDYHLSQVDKLRIKLEMGLKAEVDAKVIGEKSERAAHITCIQIAGINSEDFLMRINHRLAISNGSACNSSNMRPSQVLTAMGFNENEAFSTLRLSLGMETTEEEIDLAISIIKEAVYSE
ncbi:cysteine desulfurase [Crocinitomix catalasitica]|nr:cysteine desulfurase [Crocinitomix catalasitica]